ncbi:MAG: glutamate synthase-related protein, partial [Hydrogenophaga sp.]
MSSRSLVAPPSMGLPIAQMRSVFSADDVERKLAHLQAGGNEREYDALRNTLQRMLERGPQRFAVKPSGVPEMAPLYDLLPNFGEVLDDVKRHVALSQDSRDSLEVTPILLLGPPGVGKTHFARQIADLLGTSMSLVPMSSMTAGWLLSGSSSQWKGAKPGKGGILPGIKVTPEIAAIRGIPAGRDSLSPNRHVEVDSVTDLL